MTLSKYVKINGVFTNFNLDTLTYLSGAQGYYQTKPSALLFKDSTITFLQFTAEWFYNTLYVVDNNTDLASALLNAPTSGTIVNANTQDVYTYISGNWTISSDTTLYGVTVKPGRLYRNPLSGSSFFSDGGQILYRVMAVATPIAAQSDVTAGTGTGWVTPLTLKTAKGSW